MANIDIGGRLHSTATGNVVAGSNEILDDSLNKKQNQINSETYVLVQNVNDALASLSPEQQGAIGVAEKANSNESKLGYYVCLTEGNVAAKTIVAANYILGSGGSIKIKMNNANTVNNATLNINSTGAKALYYAGERASAINSWEAGETVEVYYDGTSFYANSVAGGSGSGDNAFDISAKTGNTYETLSAALTAANSILSASKKKGGMSIKFIQLIPATYTVVKTEGVETQPSGTEIQEALSFNSGTYTAAQMTGITPPASGSVTYYLAVTVDETTTYTTWVITKTTSDAQKYVQYRLMATAWSTTVSNWQGVDDAPTPESKNLVQSGGVFDFTNAFANEKSMYCTPLIELPLYNKNISSSGSYSTGKHSFVRIYPGDTIIINVPDIQVNFAMTKSHNTDYIDFCDGTSVVVVGGSGNPKTVTLTAPEDAKYLLIGRVVSTVDRTQYIKLLSINGYDIVTSLYGNFEKFKNDVNNTISDVQENMESISNDVESISTDLYGGDIEVPTILNTGSFWDSRSTVAVLDTYAAYYSSEPVTIENDTAYKIEIVTASSNKQNPVLIVDENYTILKKYPRGDDHTSVTTFNIAKEDFPAGSKFILLTGTSSTKNNTKVYKIQEGVDDKVSELQEDVDDIHDVISHLENNGVFDFAGKNVAIIGDSISTNGDWSVSNPLGNIPEIIVQTEDVGIELSAYATSYDVGTVLGGHEIVSSDVGNELTFTPTVEDVGKIIGKPYNRNAASYVVWWEVASEYLGFNPIPVAWSGSTITGDSVSSAIHVSQIRKCGIRTPGTMTRTAPDMIIIYRGTNDFSHGSGTVLTKDYFDGDSIWYYPTTDVVEGGRGYLEGMCLLIKKLREAYPSAQIVLCTLNYFHRGDAGFPTRNSKGNTLMEYNRAIRDTANWLGCGVIDFDKDGITFENAVSGGYYSDSDQSNPTHPNTKGHKVMGNRAIIDLLNINSMT